MSITEGTKVRLVAPWRGPDEEEVVVPEGSLSTGRGRRLQVEHYRATSPCPMCGTRREAGRCPEHGIVATDDGSHLWARIDGNGHG